MIHYITLHYNQCSVKPGTPHSFSASRPGFSVCRQTQFYVEVLYCTVLFHTVL